MKHINGIRLIVIDHGYGNIKATIAALNAYLDGQVRQAGEDAFDGTG